MSMRDALAVAAAAASIGAGTGAHAAGDPAAGQAIFKQQCTACHSVDAGKEGAGPSLHRVVGRRAGSEPGFSYTPAIKASRVTWAPATLDTFLSGPAKMIPGTAMPITLADSKQRHDVIAYLASQKK